MKKNNSIALCLVFSLILLVPMSAKSYEEAFQTYVAAYNEYKTIVAENGSKGDVDKAATNYKLAKSAYELAIGKTDSGISDTEAQNSVSVSTTQLHDARDEPVSVKPIVAANLEETSDVQRSLSAVMDEYPAHIRALVEELRETNDKERAKVIMATLETAASGGYYAKYREFIQYEIAYTLDRLGLDPKKAETIFNALKTSSNKGLANLAQLSLNYAKGKAYKARWQSAVNAKFAEMTSTHSKYEDSSWLAFPVKISRGISYLSKSVSHVNLQNDYDDFILKFEAAQAPFITNVDSVFREYQLVTENPEEDASIRLVYGNYESWYARWKIINEARSTLDIQYFIIGGDTFGLALLGACLQRAKDGLDIRLMVDTRGSTTLSIFLTGYLEELSSYPNVEVKVYNPIKTNFVGMFTDIRRMVSGNHDKIMIADGRYSITGGRNITGEYLIDPIDMPDAWRDTDVIIDSENVSSQLQVAFESEFNNLKAYEVGNSLLSRRKLRTLRMEIAYLAMDAALNLRNLPKLPEKYKSEESFYEEVKEELSGYKHMNGYPDFELMTNSYECPVQIVDSHSLSGSTNDATENIIKYIDGSRKEIIIQNPYIVFTPRADAALKRASKRGIPILIHTNSPQTSDSAPTEGMLYHDWRSILTDMPTSRLFARVNEGQLHAKNFVFDSKIGIVGTYNLDYLSEQVNSEVIAVVKSEGFSDELRHEIVTDINKSVEYHLGTDELEEFGPDDVEGGKNMWLVKTLSKMGWLKPLF